MNQAIWNQSCQIVQLGVDIFHGCKWGKALTFQYYLATIYEARTEKKKLEVLFLQETQC